MAITVEEKFEAFHAANPHVYVLFKTFALQALQSGAKKMSSKLIVERIRWEAAITTSGAGWSTTAGKPFLIDNRFTPWYARKFIKDFPRAASMFELREIRTP
jgi:hypothetical protein